MKPSPISLKGGRFVLFVLLLFLLVLPFTGCGKAGTEGNEAYTTEKYDVQINVQGDNTAYITETITVNAKKPITGIQRSISLAQTLEFYGKDNTVLQKTRKNIQVDAITVEKDTYTAKKQNGNMVIRIGDEKKTFTGEHTYVLNYKVAMYDDGIKDYDVFYYNVIPEEWQSKIKDTHITVNMPASVEKKDVHVLCGKGKKVYKDKDYEWSQEGNTISIQSKKALPAASYITVGIMLPEGYFSNELSDRKFYLGMLIAALAAAALMFRQWIVKGRDPKSVKTVEFYPPEGLTPAEVGYVIDGKTDKKDVLSLLTYFANKGNLTVAPTQENSYLFTKVTVPAHDAKPFEDVFFKGLFDQREQVNTKDLGGDFAASVNTTKVMVEQQYKGNENRLFTKTANKGRILGFAISILLLGAVGYLAGRLYGNLFLLAPAILGLGLLLASFVFGIRAEARKYSSTRKERMFTSVLSLGLMVGAALVTFLYLKLSLGALWVPLALVIFCVGSYLSVRFMQSRTAYGTELLGKLLGFKEFIRVAEQDKLEMMMQDDPQYFYNVLPYAYVMGLTKQWCQKFEHMPMAPPPWYAGAYGAGPFNTMAFYGDINGFTSAAGRNVGSAAKKGGDKTDT